MNEKIKIYSDLLTWLNGRVEKIEIIHKGRKVELWTSGYGNSIEDSIMTFCEKNKIDITDEITRGIR